MSMTSVLELAHRVNGTHSTTPYCPEPESDFEPEEDFSTPFTKAEAHRSISLAKQYIKKSKENMTVVRMELYRQMERRAWAVLGFDSFEDFAWETYHYARAYAYQLANAAKTERELSAIADLEYSPLREYPLRLLATVKDNKRIEVYRKAKELAGTGEPTGSNITAAARELGCAPMKKMNKQIKSNPLHTTLSTNFAADVAQNLKPSVSTAEIPDATFTEEVAIKHHRVRSARYNQQTGGLHLACLYGTSEIPIVISAQELASLGLLHAGNTAPAPPLEMSHYAEAEAKKTGASDIHPYLVIYAVEIAFAEEQERTQPWLEPDEPAQRVLDAVDAIKRYRLDSSQVQLDKLQTNALLVRQQMQQEARAQTCAA